MNVFSVFRIQDLEAQLLSARESIAHLRGEDDRRFHGDEAMIGVFGPADSRRRERSSTSTPAYVMPVPAPSFPTRDDGWRMPPPPPSGPPPMLPPMGPPPPRRTFGREESSMPMAGMPPPPPRHEGLKVNVLAMSTKVIKVKLNEGGTSLSF